MTAPKDPMENNAARLNSDTDYARQSSGSDRKGLVNGGW